MQTIKAKALVRVQILYNVSYVHPFCGVMGYEITAVYRIVFAWRSWM